MELSDLQTRTSQRLDEGQSGPTYYTDAEITAALNEGLRFFCFLTLALEKTASWAVPGYSSNPSGPWYHMLATFTDWIVPLRIATPSGAKVRPSRIADLEAVDSLWWNRPALPTRYVSLGCDLVGIYGQPAVAGTTLNVTYARMPVALVNPTDVPETPEEYHPDLIDYALNRLRQAEGGQEFEKTLDGLNRFFDGAQRYSAYVRARNLGSRYDKVPFELESFDRSELLKLRSDLPPLRKPGP